MKLILIKNLRKSILLILLIILFCINSSSATIEVGKGENWVDVYFNNINYFKGSDGTLDIRLDENKHRIVRQTDLYLDFDKTLDSLPNYDIIKTNFAYDSFRKKLGDYSAKFFRLNDKIRLQPKSNSLFSEYNDCGDFTIEFWMNPQIISNNATILSKYGTVLLKDFQTFNSGIMIKLENGKITAKFENFFLNLSQIVDQNTENDNLLELKSKNIIRRNAWQHIAISFDSTNGKLTLYINGKEQDYLWCTADANPNSTILVPRFNKNENSLLEIGENFFGNLDEITILRKKKYYFGLNNLYLQNGIVLSKVYDLGAPGSIIKNIKINHQVKGSSKVLFEYRIRNRYFTPDNDKIKWIELNSENNNLKYKNKGQYFQWRMTLSKSLAENMSPIVNDILINYEKNVVPNIPEDLQVFSKNGKVLLTWKSVTDKDLLGYKIYFGLEERNYVNSNSPIVVLKSQLEDPTNPYYILDNLSLGELYFISITAFDKEYQESNFSNELHIYTK